MKDEARRGLMPTAESLERRSRRSFVDGRSSALALTFIGCNVCEKGKAVHTIGDKDSRSGGILFGL
jgi:hypothetical protein